MKTYSDKVIQALEYASKDYGSNSSIVSFSDREFCHHKYGDAFSKAELDTTRAYLRLLSKAGLLSVEAFDRKEKKQLFCITLEMFKNGWFMRDGTWKNGIGDTLSKDKALLLSCKFAINTAMRQGGVINNE